MGKHWCYFLFMIWFSYLVVSSILLFARGFLLSKNAQKSNSTCLSFAEIPCVPSEQSTISINHKDDCSDDHILSNLLQNVNSASSICLPQKTRIILVLIDALRYDFALFDEKLPKPLHFQNKLPIIDKLQREHPNSTRLYKFVADPPTTTMQRLKALTTGSLPTFIDAGSNFATNEINEDNIIDQLLRHNRSTVLIGDDTWDGLYPHRFLRKYPYPSFDVWDLDTVDNGVTKHLYPELKRKDWSFLIAHYLGVDHCGHRYGPNHPEMKRKLTEMNTVIENIAKDLDSNTMLFVIGDHGMTVTGNHGGDSDDEVESAFFIYSKQPLSTVTPHSETIRQVSIVPTMAAIFGVSVPFSNLGTIILDALPIANHSHIQEWQWGLFYLWGNVQQMLTYIEDYSRTSSETFSETTMIEIRQKFAILNSKLLSVSSEMKFQDFTIECVEFLTKLRETCEEVWIQFDSFSMARGLLFLFLSMFFVFIIIDGIPSHRLPEIFMSSFLTCSYLMLFLAAALAVILHHFQFVSNLTSTIFFFTGVASQFMLGMLVIQNWELISLNWYDRSQKERIPNLICRLILVFHLCGLFSNSFVVEESSVLLFLLNSVILIGTLSAFNSEPKFKKNFKVKWKLLAVALAILILVRFSMYFWRCRDRLEQPWCYDTYNAFTAKVETTKLQWIITVIILALFVTITKVWLRSCGNLNGYSLTVILLKYAPTVLVVAMSGYWVLNRLPKDAKMWQTDALAWLVYALSTFSIITVVMKPLCVYILPNYNEFSVQTETNVIPQLFQRVKKLLSEPSREDVPVICGLATVYSAVYAAITIFLTLIFALLHGDGVAPSIIIMFLATAFVLIIMSIIRLERAGSVEELLEIPNVSILVWVILCQYFFYGTGHQPSFPNIIWDAAFIGTSNVLQYHFIPATLIIINTFCSQILTGFLLPLMIVMPFTVSVLLPSFTSCKNAIQKDNLRGEVLLYERDSLMVTIVFTTICKYIICHGIRVFATMLVATIHCRHMMIWKIFAPKLIFESIGMFVTIGVVNVSYLVLIRVNDKVDQLIVSLNKRSS